MIKLVEDIRKGDIQMKGSHLLPLISIVCLSLLSIISFLMYSSVHNINLGRLDVILQLITIPALLVLIFGTIMMFVFWKTLSKLNYKLFIINLIILSISISLVIIGTIVKQPRICEKAGSNIFEVTTLHEYASPQPQSN